LKGDFADDFRVIQSNSAVSAQKVDNGWLIDAGRLPPYSISTLEVIDEALPIGAGIVSALVASPTLLENRYLRVELNDQGDIGRIFDKRCAREVIVEGKVANQFQLFEDRPRTPDAWDIDIFYDDKVWFADPAASITVKENGPLRASVEIQRAIFGSQITQTISLYRNSPLIVFDTKVDWVERNVLLKVAFPIEVLSPHATYEIQWGNVERATHINTSWDWAKFETCAHKWVDLSEGGYGVSLINDCKYGHDIHKNVIRLTLLRGTSDPDPKADLGFHNFSYALLPHQGSWDETTLAYAYAFNDPAFVAPCEKTADSSPSSGSRWAGNSLIQTSSPNIIIETIKVAEDGQGIIIRLYESMRVRDLIRVQTMTPIVAAWRTDLLENNLETMQFTGNTIDLPVDPFEIITLRIILEK
jgi:alpha-mannosidase